MENKVELPEDKIVKTEKPLIEKNEKNLKKSIEEEKEKYISNLKSFISSAKMDNELRKRYNFRLNGFETQATAKLKGVEVWSRKVDESTLSGLKKSNDELKTLSDKMQEETYLMIKNMCVEDPKQYLTALKNYNEISQKYAGKTNIKTVFLKNLFEDFAKDTLHELNRVISVYDGPIDNRASKLKNEIENIYNQTINDKSAKPKSLHEIFDDLERWENDLGQIYNDEEKIKKGNKNLNSAKSNKNVAENDIEEVEVETEETSTEAEAEEIISDIDKKFIFEVEPEETKIPEAAVEETKSETPVVAEKTYRKSFDINNDNDFNKLLASYAEMNKTYYDGHKRTPEEVQKRKNLNAQMKRILAQKDAKNTQKGENSVEKFVEGEFNESDIAEIANDTKATIKLFSILANGTYKDNKLTQKQRQALANVMQKVSEKRLDLDTNKKKNVPKEINKNYEKSVETAKGDSE